MNLENLRKKQISLQKKAHNHKDYSVNLELTEGVILKNFKVLEKVLRPEKMSAMFLARWLFFNNGLYNNKTIIDMGCGSGIQGITCGIYGAKKVIFTDISKQAYKNTLENVKKFNLEAKSEVQIGNLFEKVKEKADIIIFNHPFFHDNNFEDHLNDTIMESKGSLIHEFLRNAGDYMRQDSAIIMPYFHLAGPINNPEIQARKHGYSVKEAFNFNSTTGLQKGNVSIYIITKK